MYEGSAQGELRQGDVYLAKQIIGLCTLLDDHGDAISSHPDCPAALADWVRTMSQHPDGIMYRSHSESLVSVELLLRLPIRMWIGDGSCTSQDAIGFLHSALDAYARPSRQTLSTYEHLKHSFDVVMRW